MYRPVSLSGPKTLFVTESQEDVTRAAIVTGWGGSGSTWVPQVTYHAVARSRLRERVAVCGSPWVEVDVRRPWTGQGDADGLACPECVHTVRRFGSTQAYDPTAPSLFVELEDYMARVNDVARRFAQLPADSVLKALRTELADFEHDEATLVDMAGRISRGEFTAPPV